MKKKAWPWIGSTEVEMGAGEFSREKDSQERPATFSVGETISPANEPLKHESGVQSPLNNVASDSKHKKKKNKISVDFFNNKEDILATFSCDLAKSLQEKVIGLQGYDHLSDTAGLVFEYEKPEDVIYHMGTVKFPIDIIFIDENDNVKKLYKDIQPGTLGTFGCANVKNVLEICGGLCDRLGISAGNKAVFSKDLEKDSFAKKISEINKFSKDLGINKNIIIKYSNVGKGAFFNWKSFPILNVNNKIVKTAERETLLSDFISKNVTHDSRNINVFDFDGLIEKSPMIRLFKVARNVEGSRIYITLDGTTASIVKNASTNDEVYKDFHIKDVLTKKFKNDITIISSANKSYENFMKEGSSDLSKMFSKLRETVFNKDSRAIVVTRFPNPKYLKEIISSKYKNTFGDYPDFEIIKIADLCDAEDITNIMRNKYGNKDYNIYSDESLLKRAGIPVSNSIKESAKEAYKKLDDAYNLSKDSLDGIKKNLDEYTKFTSSPNLQPEALEGTKGQYNQSCKNNKEKFISILEKIKESIKTLDDVADTVTTPQIIESMTASSKASSETVQEIFNLVEKLSAPDFINLLTEKTTAYEKSIEDLRASIDSARKHINSDILGLVVLAE